MNGGNKPERRGKSSGYSNKKDDRRDSDRKRPMKDGFSKSRNNSDEGGPYSGPKRKPAYRGEGKDKPFESGDKRRSERSFKSSDRREGGKSYKPSDRKPRYDSKDGESEGRRNFKSSDRREGGKSFKSSDGKPRYQSKDRENDSKRNFKSSDRREGGKSFKSSDGKPRHQLRDRENDGRRNSGRNERNNSEGRFKSKGSSDKTENRRYRDESKEERKRPRTKKLNEKDQELLGDWRKERPVSELHRKSDKSHEIKTITEEVRLNKYLSNSGLCSRRDADEFILNGAVTVNGIEVKELGVRVKPGDEIRFKGRLILPEKPVYILMNKPKDCITSAVDPEGRRTVLDIIGDHVPQRIFPVGRLDRNTTGVLLLTNDGDLSQKLTHPSFGVHKIYKAELNKAMTKADLDKLSEGVELEDGFIKPDEIAYVDESRRIIGVEIHSGKNHIVHRMFNSLGYLVDKLDRVTFAGLSKDGLKRGDIRHLTEKELLTLRKESGKKK